MNDTVETVSGLKSSNGFNTGYRVLLVPAIIVAFGPITLANQVFWDDPAARLRIK